MLVEDEEEIAQAITSYFQNIYVSSGPSGIKEVTSLRAGGFQFSTCLFCHPLSPGRM